MAEDNQQKPQQAVLRSRLAAILTRHPEFTNGQEGSVPSIPARALGKVFDAYSDEYDIAILPLETRQQLEGVVSQADSDITLDQVIDFIVRFTAASPSSTSPVPPQNASAAHDWNAVSSSPELKLLEAENWAERGRMDERDASGSQSRSSSNDSVVTSFYRPNGRRSRAPSSSGPQTPSPFDSTTRQRTLPLAVAAPPSAFKPQAPFRRRKSDSSGQSDGESSNPATPDSSFTATRRRTPSNPASMVSPSTTALPSYPRPESPGARTRVPGQSPDFPPLGGSFVFPRTNRRSPSTKNVFQQQQQQQSSPEHVEHELDDNVGNDSMDSVDALLSLHMVPSSSSDDEDTASINGGMIVDHTRSLASSNASSMTTPEDRLEVMRRAKAELERKLKENEKALLERLSEREQEIEDLESRVDELKTELAASRKEEKELKAKERLTGKQLSNFEQEITKLGRQLETSKQNYQNMVKLYNEQLSESEKYRNQLRERDIRIKHGEQAMAERAKELHKVQGEKEIVDNSNESLREELDAMSKAHQELEEQKHENLLLKETIDRLRYDMDQSRAEASGTVGSIRGLHSVPGTMSKSFANELKNSFKGDDASESERERERNAVEDEMTVEELGYEGDESREEDEDYVETIITTSRRRKVGPRASAGTVVHIEDDKEYADEGVQHESSEHSVTVEIQTDSPPRPPMKVSMDIQTESLPVEVVAPTPAPPPRLTATVEVQTDPLPVEESLNAEAGPSSLRGVKQEDDDDVDSKITPTTASSSSFPLDSPPSYETLAADERHKLLQKWHPGLHGVVSVDGVEGGVSSTVLREWNNVKKELGFECIAIDRTLQASVVNGERDGGAGNVKEEADEDLEEIVPGGRRGSRKFYNIYNTYVLGNGATPGASDAGADGAVPWVVRWRDLMMLGLGAGVVLLAVGIPMVGTAGDPQNLANTFIGTHITGPHGHVGPRDTSDAIWLVMEKVFRHGLDAARRAPQYAPT
ncbi:hypothetical protein FRB98_005926 [Tulasnella sp. 332]|nr:hypothetical protein FRB98_005926 [Tulasnella sp. 332]